MHEILETPVQIERSTGDAVRSFLDKSESYRVRVVGWVEKPYFGADEILPAFDTLTGGLHWTPGRGRALFGVLFSASKAGLLYACLIGQ